MHSLYLALSLTFTFAIASPIIVPPFIPPTAPEYLTPSTKDIKDGPTGNTKCGDITYSADRLTGAALYAMALQDNSMTRGANSYPHVFGNKDKAGNDVLSLTGDCADGTKRQEYPLTESGNQYNGGKNNKQISQDRAIYAYSVGDASATYCGTVTHSGTTIKGDFISCAPG